MKTHKTKCSWPDCGQKIEFEEIQKDTKQKCPCCNRDIYLTVTESALQKFIKLIPKQDDTVKSIRNQSCYKFTRIFITIIQWLFYITAIFILVGYLSSFIHINHPQQQEQLYNLSSFIPDWLSLGAIKFILTCWFVTIFGFLGSLWKETTSMLVDIADIQISLFKRK